MLPYPIRKVTTAVPVEGGVAGGALAMSAGTSPVRKRTPTGGKILGSSTAYPLIA